MGGAGPLERATTAVHSATRVSRDKAVALIEGALRTGLKKRGDRALEAVAELPEDDQSAALGSVVDDLEQEGYALYRVREDGDE